MRVAFLSPMKAPDDPRPSGERTMARLLMRALGHAGHEVRLASRLRTFDGLGRPEFQARAAVAGAREAARLAASSWRPDLVFAYHPYYKAPDLVGPGLANALGLPYVVAQASHAPRRSRGPWAAGAHATFAAIRRADLIVGLCPRDAAAIDRIAPRTEKLRLLPFLDTDDWPEPPLRRPGGPVRLVAVAMMRAGRKLESYTRLARALHAAADLPWSLSIVGDGPARGAVERLFAPHGSRIRMLGELGGEAVRAVLGASDLLAWPGTGEAYGMAYLEAAAMGVPALAERSDGVASVVRDGATGLLTRPDDGPDYGRALRALLCDRARLHAMGRAAFAFARGERGLAGASRALGSALARPRRAA
ncbi:MAG: glycosyltransferase family 4 protein [Alphaproteobacteria bacterium]|nr:glycosyltransferase family 4 protein [Alphaproteobacteria bacterium]